MGEFFRRDWNFDEKVLFSMTVFLLGTVIGFMFSPIKKGIHCCNDIGDTYVIDEDQE